MAKYIRFKDGANDEHAVSAEMINGAYITADVTIILHVRPLDPSQLASSTITLTVTAGKNVEVLDEILGMLFKNDVAVAEISASHPYISTVAFEEGV